MKETNDSEPQNLNVDRPKLTKHPLHDKLLEPITIIVNMRSEPTLEASLLHASVSIWTQKSIHALTKPADEHLSDRVLKHESILTWI